MIIIRKFKKKLNTNIYNLILIEINTSKNNNYF